MRRILFRCVLLILCAVFPFAIAHALGSEALPDPALLLGTEAVLFQQDYQYDALTLCDAYTLPMPADWEEFLIEYIPMAKRAGYTVTEAQESGMALWMLEDSKGRIARLVPNFRGSLLLIVQKGMDYAAPAALTPLPTSTPVVENNAYNASGGSLYSGNFNASSSADDDGEWVWIEEEYDCTYCTAGECSLCNGSGTYQFLGVKRSCDKECSACDGRGYMTQRVREYVLK